jgi:predicted porin
LHSQQFPPSLAQWLKPQSLASLIVLTPPLKQQRSANASTSASTLAPSGSGQNQITFAASEDLGSGLKAFANLRIVPSPNAAGAIGADASEIGLSGGFGTFQIGKDYSIDHAVIAQVDASGYTGGSKGVVNIGNGGASSNAVVYVLPTIGSRSWNRACQRFS